MHGINSLENVNTHLTDNTVVTVTQAHCCSSACRFGSLWSESYASVIRAACMHHMTHEVQECLGLCVPFSQKFGWLLGAVIIAGSRSQIALIAASAARCAALVKLTNWGSVMTRACTCNHARPRCCKCVELNQPAFDRTQALHLLHIEKLFQIVNLSFKQSVWAPLTVAVHTPPLCLVQAALLALNWLNSCWRRVTTSEAPSETRLTRKRLLI